MNFMACVLTLETSHKKMFLKKKMCPSNLKKFINRHIYIRKFIWLGLIIPFNSGVTW